MTKPPDPEPILDLIEAFRRSKTMFTALTLGVFDALESEPQSSQALAPKLGLHEGALSRLLAACLALELLERDEFTYRNSALASRYLVNSSPDTLAGYIAYSDQSLYQLWTHLDDAIREGTHRWVQVFGSRDSLFAHYFRDEKSTAAFVTGMHGFGQIASDKVARQFDLSHFKHLVDLGGATGHLAVAICEAYPSLRATVLDLPRVAPIATAYLATTSVAERVEFVTGDFFTGDIPHGDLYILSRILHDWDEAKIHTLLAKILAALEPGGGLLIAEKLVNEDHSGPLHAMMQDLNMLVVTDGRERNCSEYTQLLKDAGFSTVECKRTSSTVDAILAIK